MLLFFLAGGQLFGFALFHENLRFVGEYRFRNFSKRAEPPRLCGQLSHPAESEQIAKMTSGIVIDFGDSCT